jgi:hypothetical protein
VSTRPVFTPIYSAVSEFSPLRQDSLLFGERKLGRLSGRFGRTVVREAPMLQPVTCAVGQSFVATPSIVLPPHEFSTEPNHPQTGWREIYRLIRFLLIRLRPVNQGGME